MKPTRIFEFNAQFQHALSLMEHTHKNVFITGKAGTGKSTLLQYFRDHTKKKVVVLAPTGVAALNVRGQTIHSFFGFKPDITLAKVKKVNKGKGVAELYKKLEAIVIDEISMVRADMLDCIDKFMRLHGPDKVKPFGGVQMIFIGDLFQLPPVVTSDEKEIVEAQYATPYFFSARVFSPPQSLFQATDTFAMEFVELQKVYRQEDQGFIALLNAIRNNVAGPEDFALLNARYQRNFNPPASEMWITLTTTNRMAQEVNEYNLAQLKGKEYVFEGVLTGSFDTKSLPTELSLKVKKGARIMMLNNDREGRWVNGTVGVVKDITEEEGVQEVVAELSTGEIFAVTPHQWDMFHFSYDSASGQVVSDLVGSFVQYPFRLAWAVTIHKSQGKTFDKVAVDVGTGTFSPGQLYVALSRCTSLQGLVLKKPITARHIWLDARVSQFVSKFTAT